MSNVDIVPETLEQIQKDFQRRFQKDATVKRIYELIKQNAVDYEDANEFAIRLGEMLSESLKTFITVDTLPEGRMWYNIASRIMTPTLSTNHALISDVCYYAQKAVNDKAGISLKVIQPALNTNKIEGFVDKLSNAEDFKNVEYMLGEPVVNYSMSVVDDSIKVNADFHANAGLTPIIRRRTGSHEVKTEQKKPYRKYAIPCKWCQSLEGVYNYFDMPDYVADNIFRKHEGCRCIIEYIDAEKKQDAHSKVKYDLSREDRIQLSQMQSTETAQDRINRLG